MTKNSQVPEITADPAFLHIRRHTNTECFFILIPSSAITQHELWGELVGLGRGSIFTGTSHFGSFQGLKSDFRMYSDRLADR